MKKKSAFVFLAVLLSITISPAGLVARFASVMTHSGIVLSAWTWSTPSIDGAIGEEEWSAAAKVDFNIINASAPDGMYNGTMYVMNDYDNLYLAVKITDDDFGNDGSTFDVLFFLFDNDNSGLPSVQGDDGLFCWSISGPPFDAFFYNYTVGWPSDTDYGGTSDGESAVSGDGNYNYFELMHPLNSADDDHDFSLKFRDVIGFCMVYHDNRTMVGFWPSVDSVWLWNDIKIAAPFWQGDLVLSGNDFYTINGEFNINGSIIVTENATLVLKDAFVNLTQTENYQFNITLKDAVDGKPRLIVDNATIDTGGYFFNIALYENSTAQVDGLKENSGSIIWLVLNDVSSAEVTNSDFLGVKLYNSSVLNLTYSAISSIHVHNNAVAAISNIETYYFYAAGNSNVQMQDSEITHVLKIYSSTRQTLISNLKPDLIAYWNYWENCSVVVEGGGFAPHITLTNVMVGNWSFSFMDAQHTIISSSELYELTSYGSSATSVYYSYIHTVELFGSSRLNATDSAAYKATLHGTSLVWSLNSTGASVQINEQAIIYDNWCLDVYVKDSVGNDVPQCKCNSHVF